MEMPQPNQAHQRLTALAGRWVGQETIPPCPWDPAGGQAVGTCENRVAASGFILTQDYQQTRHGAVNFTGHGVFSYDAATQSYLLHWWDSMGVAVNVFKGGFTGNTLAMTCKDHQGYSRASWQIQDAGQYYFRMEMSQDGQQWMTLMEGTYVRQDA